MSDYEFETIDLIVEYGMMMCPDCEVPLGACACENGYESLGDPWADDHEDDLNYALESVNDYYYDEEGIDYYAESSLFWEE